MCKDQYQMVDNKGSDHFSLIQNQGQNIDANGVDVVSNRIFVLARLFRIPLLYNDNILKT